MKTAKGRVLRQMFDGAFQAVRKEAIRAAVALGFKPGRGLERAVDRDYYRRYFSQTPEQHAALSRAHLARLNCEEIILFLLDWPQCADPLQPFPDEIGVVCKMLDELNRDLPFALAA